MTDDEADARVMSDAPLRVVLVTQDEPFYLGASLGDFLKRLPAEIVVVGAVVLSGSPFGRDKGLVAKAIQTWRVFGSRFFLHYAFRLLLVNVDRRDRVPAVLTRSGIPLMPIQDINAASSLDQIAALRPDVLLSVQANQIFRRPLLDLPRITCLNLHTGMLPKYRGLTPTFWALKNGEVEIGVSVFLIDEGVDSGPILVQESYKVTERDWDTVIRETKTLGMSACIDALRKVAHGELETIPNDARDMTKFSAPTRADVEDFLARGNRFF